MHSLDPLLKSLILKIVIAVLIGLAGVVSIPVGILLSRRILKNKSLRIRIAIGVLLTGLLFSVSAVALAAAGAAVLVVTVINPGYKRDCAATMQKIVQRGSEWASAHDGRFPSDFTFLSAERGYHFILPCQRETNDTDQEAAQRSYQIVTPGAPADVPSAVFLRCPYHQHASRIDRTIVPDQPRT